MRGKLIGVAEVKLTAAQLHLARDLVAAHQNMGDCELHGFRLRFPDYEGAHAFQRKVFALGIPSTRAFVSMNAIIRKIDAAIVRAAQAKHALREKAVGA